MSKFDPATSVQNLAQFGEFGDVNPSITDSATYTFMQARTMSDTFAGETEDKSAAFIWQNFYYKENRINEYCITFFSKQKNGLYNRFEEQHFQRAYSINYISKMLVHSKLNIIKILGEDLVNEPEKKSERVYIVCMKGNDNKIHGKNINS